MKAALVTGASRGLGLAVARRLVRDGWRVGAVARRPSPELDALREESPDAVVFLACDLADLDGLGELARRARAEVGPLFGLVNNAGGSLERLLSNTRASEIEALTRLNLVSPLVLTKFVARSMLADGRGGRIVSISSIMAETGFSGLSVYGATKAGLVGFTRSLARELGAHGVTVNAVSPGFVETELTRGLGAEGVERVARRAALRRLAEPSDVAGAVSYLLSDDARRVTGTVLTVDAGATA